MNDTMKTVDSEQAQGIALQNEIQATELDIERSVKVGKQVMIKQLKEALDQLDTDQQNYQVENREKFDRLREKAVKDLEKSFWLEIKNDSTLNDVRVAFNALLEKEHRFKNNKKLVHKEDLNFSRTLDNAELSSVSILNNIWMWYKLKIARMEGQYFEDPIYEYHRSITATPHILEWLEFKEEYDNILRDMRDKKNTLEDKLNNIDSVTEEIEASLLVNEMQGSDRGQQVLEMTGNIVADVLGTKPQLLTVDSNEEPEES